jgi:hypothetical protein
MRPVAQQPDLPMQHVPAQNEGQFPLRAVPQIPKPAAQTPTNMRAQAPVTGAAAQPVAAKSPYDDPNYDAYPHNYNPINAMLNVARPARKSLYEAGLR